MKKELIAAFTTFLTMAYIIAVNPAMLASEGTGIGFSAAVTATILAASFGTILMGLYARLPYALAPGMGLNAFFTYTLIFGEKIPYQTALGVVFLSGLIFLVLSITPFRALLIKSIPTQLRLALAIGIGLFLTFIGLKNMGLVVSHPVTLVTVGKLDAMVVTSLAGLFLGGALVARKNHFAMLITIIFVTLVAAFLGRINVPDQIVQAPDFSLFGDFDLMGALKWSLFPAILSFMLTDLMDTLSTFIGVSQAADLKDENDEPKNLKKGMIVDALATTFSGIVGTSPTTTYIESAAGVEMGGRSGLTAVFCGLLFLPFLFIAPVIQIIPAAATAPVLILVGCLMGKSFVELRIEKIEEFLPAFLVILLIPLTFSISQGIIYGFLAHIVMYSLVGRVREIHPILLLITILGLAVLH